MRPALILRTTAKKSSFTPQFITKRNITNTLSKSIAQPVPTPSSSNPQISFPCLDKLEKKTNQLRPSHLKPSAAASATQQRPSTRIIEQNQYKNEDEGEYLEPIYARVQSGFQTYHSSEPLFLDYGGLLPSFDIAFETWGTLNSDKSNAILLHTGLSASSHAKSQSNNMKPGWWENFIGPDKPLDTNKYFVICTNVIGGCYGSTGPSSIDPQSNDQRYATRFPILSINDMTRAQNRLISDHFNISKLYASVGSSMGGMQSLAYGQEFPDQVNKIVSISGCARSHPYSIAMRHTQRQVLMSDPNWNRGHYYDSVPPHVGMKLSREIATITYRSGPEWELRFGRDRIAEKPSLCPDFLIETYLDHQGEKFSIEYDPNSLLYVSKAMDLFDLGRLNRERATVKREEIAEAYSQYRECFQQTDSCSTPVLNTSKKRSVSVEESERDLLEGLKPLSNHQVLVIGVKSDILFPHWQQAEIAEKLREGNKKFYNGQGENVQHVELDEDVSIFGHDTFLLDLEHVGGPIKNFLN
ncbi:hypothetical protein WICPIJ_006776 [Wickerhamomyces pijperi]|uniref:AB hydrolase-1 domain-containing protein n=1 Tax=Wickerhamomyces pijperi TaxID=599730 RepID=A0A9P8TL37_WICPI|nr:hypothetical protein WICPIJ_006776 [Wickerhamomyces pijperi]